MKTIDALGKPCPIPVVEAKKALKEQGENIVVVKVDNFEAVQNLEKMAKGYGYGYFYIEHSKESYEATISKAVKDSAMPQSDGGKSLSAQGGAASGGLAVVISRNTMGDGAEELGKILIKGFIYSLTALAVPPKHVIFFNSGAYLTSERSNTIDDLKTLEQFGTEVLTCGTCANYYNLKPVVGTIIDMYGITERMASSGKVINI